MLVLRVLCNIIGEYRNVSRERACHVKRSVGGTVCRENLPAKSLLPLSLEFVQNMLLSELQRNRRGLQPVMPKNFL